MKNGKLPHTIFVQLGTVDLLFPVDVTPRNGFELVHGFSYEFRNIQCLHYSATQIHVPQFIIKSFYYSFIPTIQHSHIHFPSQQSHAISYTLPLEHVE
jgi:hypothetical protein